VRATDVGVQTERPAALRIDEPVATGEQPAADASPVVIRVEERVESRDAGQSVPGLRGTTRVDEQVDAAAAAAAVGQPAASQINEPVAAQDHASVTGQPVTDAW